MPSPEWLLVLGVVGFYLQDAALLLYADEFVVHGRPRRWRARADGVDWSGRLLWIPPVLGMHDAGFRGTWPPAPGPAAPSPRQVRAYLRALLPFRIGAAWLAALLFAGLPLLLWRYPHPLALLALLLAVYATVATLAWLLWRARARFGLEARAFWWLAFECIACPPHAVNLVRKLTLRHAPAGMAGAIASTQVDAADLARLEASLRQRRGAIGELP